jgi:hypothetical protein
MVSFTSNPTLAPIYRFFEKAGTERLQGLDPSYFVGLNESEKEEAWNFLSDGFASSTDTISGLYYLDPQRAVAAFKKEIEVPISPSPYPAERQFEQEFRLLMLQCINRIEPDEKYVTAMNEFAGSEFKQVRSQFAQSVPIHKVTRGAVDALKGMILTKTEVAPLAAAILKFMVIHRMDFNRKDPVYKSIYMSLSSDNPKEKLAAMKRLEDRQRPDYA